LTIDDAVNIVGKENIQYCTITTISESPVISGVIWVGTDDGKVWITQDGGANWKDLTDFLRSAGAPDNYGVSRSIPELDWNYVRA
jgi:hypothetical protein